MTVSPVLPFSAIVGQERMKRALVLCAINPAIGGVLIRGTKGVAKSTAVRALAEILPEIEVQAGCPFNLGPEESTEAWDPLGPVAAVRRRVPVVDLPVGATEDRVIGSIDLERAIQSGARQFEPGLLAAAHRGILYIDEVNLLGDHLVDILLDAAAMGVNHVEREGISVRHPARFILVGTMNPEEGELRPQLLDRFGLAVVVENLADPKLRAEVVRRRMAFESDPAGFRRAWQAADAAERERIAAARRLLPDVAVPDEVLDYITALCAWEGADGMRADLTIYKAAATLAAYQGQARVTPNQVDEVAELALAHRRTTPPSAPPPPPTGSPDRSRPQPVPPRSGPPNPGPRPGPSTAVNGSARATEAADRDRADPEGADHPRSQSFDIAVPRAVPSIRSVPSRVRRPEHRGRRVAGQGESGRGRYIRACPPRGRLGELALDATLRAAAPYQRARHGGAAGGPRIRLRRDDVRQKVRERHVEHLILFVVDASGSMAALQRMRQTKGAVLALLIDAYQKRDRVGLIAFRGSDARLLLPPTRSVQHAERRLAELQVGGATPLAHGLELARRVVHGSRRRNPHRHAVIVLLSDGRANVGLSGADPDGAAHAAAARLAAQGVRGLVIDTETGPVRLGRAAGLARSLGAEYRVLETLGGRHLSDAVRRAIFHRRVG